MKKTVTLTGFLLFAILLSFFIALSTNVAAASTLCERYSSFSRIFPSCNPTPPPPPADACPNVPGDQASGPCADDQCRDQGGTWNGEACELPPPPPPPDDGRATRNSCERYLLSRLSPPQSCDICPNVAGVQLIGPCADKMCVDDGGAWTDNACIMPPPDVCPNASGIQTEEPCPDQICADNGGVWNGDACELPFVRVTYPNGGETFTSSDTVEVTWEANNVDLCVLGYENAVNRRNIAVVPGTQRSFAWTVDVGNTSSPQQIIIYIICTTANAGEFDDYSDNYFTVGPSDVCPNVPGDQTSGPCADQQCVDDGGTWNGSSCVMPAPPTQCSDGIDNDGDGEIDFPADGGCSSTDDNDESGSGGGGGGGAVGGGASSGSGSAPSAGGSSGGGAGGGGGGGGSTTP